MLTDEQIEDICRAYIRRDCSKDPSGTWAHSIVFARAIEAEARKEIEAACRQAIDRAVMAERERIAVLADGCSDSWLRAETHNVLGDYIRTCAQPAPADGQEQAE
jgi:hypothetical protein